MSDAPYKVVDEFQETQYTSINEVEIAEGSENTFVSKKVPLRYIGENLEDVDLTEYDELARNSIEMKTAALLQNIEDTENIGLEYHRLVHAKGYRLSYDPETGHIYIEILSPIIKDSSRFSDLFPNKEQCTVKNYVLFLNQMSTALDMLKFKVGVAHQDLGKPDNILFNPVRGFYIIDFNIAKEYVGGQDDNSKPWFILDDYMSFLDHIQKFTMFLERFVPELNVAEINKLIDEARSEYEKKYTKTDYSDYKSAPRFSDIATKIITIAYNTPSGDGGKTT